MLVRFCVLRKPCEMSTCFAAEILKVIEAQHGSHAKSKAAARAYLCSLWLPVKAVTLMYDHYQDHPTKVALCLMSIPQAVVKLLLRHLLIYLSTWESRHDMFRNAHIPALADRSSSSLSCLSRQDIWFTSSVRKM